MKLPLQGLREGPFPALSRQTRIGSAVLDMNLTTELLHSSGQHEENKINCMVRRLHKYMCQGWFRHVRHSVFHHSVTPSRIYYSWKSLCCAWWEGILVLAFANKLWGLFLTVRKENITKQWNEDESLTYSMTQTKKTAYKQTEVHSRFTG